jgi:hypothetical protein
MDVDQQQPKRKPMMRLGREMLRQVRVMRLTLCCCTLGLGGVLLHQASANSVADMPRPVVARTDGGLVPGAQVLRVTTLADSGPGSLRAALTAQGPRVVVFEVGGVIDLASRIEIRSPSLTLAGQTAPDPGILVRGAGLVIRTSDVRLEHLAVYPGAGREGQDARAIDALALVSRAATQNEVRRIVLRNLTLAHATDENLSFAGDAISAIRLEATLIAKGLQEAGHPKGAHSMGLLIYPNIQDMAVVGNAFVNNDRRNPVVNPGVHGVIANNLVFGHGRNSIHVQRGATTRDLQTAIFGNLVQPTNQTSCGIEAVQVPLRVFLQAPGARLFLEDNQLDGRFVTRPDCVAQAPLAAAVRARLVLTPPATDPEWPTLPAAAVRDFVLRHAGSRPAARNPMDTRIMGGVSDGSGRIINSVEEEGGWPVIVQARRSMPAEIPTNLSGPAQVARLAVWLCARHHSVGGPPNGDCRAR